MRLEVIELGLTCVSGSKETMSVERASVSTHVCTVKTGGLYF